MPLTSMMDTRAMVEGRVPVVLVVGGPGVGKTAVSAAVLLDAATAKNLRTLALVPSVAAFRDALHRAGGPAPSEPLPPGCDVAQVAEEVSGGCVCCTVRRDIEDVLADEALAGAPSFELVVIDTAAASDPMPIIATLFEEHANEVRGRLLRVPIDLAFINLHSNHVPSLGRARSLNLTLSAFLHVRARRSLALRFFAALLCRASLPQVVTPEVSQCFHLDAVVCVVDGRNLSALGRTVHEARQLAFADVIVVNRATVHHDLPPAAGGGGGQLALEAAEDAGGDAGSSPGKKPPKGKDKQSKDSAGKSKKGGGGGGGGDDGGEQAVALLGGAAVAVLAAGGAAAALAAMPKSVTLTLAHPPSDDNRGCLSASTSATSFSPLLPEAARHRICSINPLVQVKELPRVFPGEGPDSAGARRLSGRGPYVAGDILRHVVGFNTYCASAFDRLDLSGLSAMPPPSKGLSPSGVTTTVVFAEGRLMQRRFRDCMSALLRLCKENIFRMRGELCYAETDDARWLFHAVHSVVTITESEGRPWGVGEPRVNLLVVTGHDLPVSELYACLRMSLIEEAEKSADAMAQALLAELGDDGGAKDGPDGGGDGGDRDGDDDAGGSKSKKAKKKAREKQAREAVAAKKKADADAKAAAELARQAAAKAEREEKMRAKLLEERRVREAEAAAWQAASAKRRQDEAELYRAEREHTSPCSTAVSSELFQAQQRQARLVAHGQQQQSEDDEEILLGEQHEQKEVQRRQTAAAATRAEQAERVRAAQTARTSAAEASAAREAAREEAELQAALRASMADLPPGHGGGLPGGGGGGANGEGGSEEESAAKRKRKKKKEKEKLQQQQQQQQQQQLKQQQQVRPSKMQVQPSSVAGRQGGGGGGGSPGSGSPGAGQVFFCANCGERTREGAPTRPGASSVLCRSCVPKRGSSGGGGAGVTGVAGKGQLQQQAAAALKRRSSPVGPGATFAQAAGARPSPVYEQQQAAAAAATAGGGALSGEGFGPPPGLAGRSRSSSSSSSSQQQQQQSPQPPSARVAQQQRMAAMAEASGGGRSDGRSGLAGMAGGDWGCSGGRGAGGCGDAGCVSCVRSARGAFPRGGGGSGGGGSAALPPPPPTADLLGSSLAQLHLFDGGGFDGGLGDLGGDFAGGGMTPAAAPFVPAAGQGFALVGACPGGGPPGFGGGGGDGGLGGSNGFSPRPPGLDAPPGLGGPSPGFGGLGGGGGGVGCAGGDADESGDLDDLDFLQEATKAGLSQGLEDFESQGGGGSGSVGPSCLMGYFADNGGGGGGVGGGGGGGGGGGSGDGNGSLWG